MPYGRVPEQFSGVYGDIFDNPFQEIRISLYSFYERFRGQAMIKKDFGQAPPERLIGLICKIILGQGFNDLDK